jgi:general stress protein 26
MAKEFINFEKLKKFIAKRKVAFVASIDNEGFPNMKAMLKPRRSIGLKEFYFRTNTSSMRVAQYRENPKASVYFYRKGLIKYEGLMLTGKMEVIEDEEIKKELWQFGDKMFYPKGVTDPDYCILKFTSNEGRYYCDLQTKSFDLVHIRPINEEELPLLETFLYESIFIPEGMEPLPFEIIKLPAIEVYIKDFGRDKDDHGIVAVFDGKIVGAVWVRILSGKIKGFGNTRNGSCHAVTPKWRLHIADRYGEVQKCGSNGICYFSMVECLLYH